MMAAVNDFERQSMGNICVNPLGNYNSAYTYMYLDGVSYEGGFYISLKNNLVGIAPTLNTSDENWFCSSISGEASEDYVRMYQEVIQNAQKVENDKNTVANDRQQAEQIKNAVLLIQSDVTGKASQVSSDKETVLQAKESVDTSEANVKQIQGEVNQSVTGFSDLVNQSTQESVSKIEESKDAALSAIRSEEESSISNMKTEADQYYSQKKETADIEIEESKNAAISSINQSGTENVNKVISESTNQISLISQEGQTQKQDVTNAGTQEKQLITDLSASKIAEISQEGTKQVGLVTKEGDTQVQRIKDEASGVIDSAQDIQDLKENKLDKNQGAENSGKAMIVGEDGLLTPGDAQTKVDETLTQTGQAADAKITGDKISDLYNTKAPIIYQTSQGTEIVVKDSTKAKFKDFGLTGNAEQLETEGTNLLDYTKSEARNSNSSVKILENKVEYTGDYYFKIPVSGIVGGKTYILSEKNNTGSWAFHYTDNSTVVTFDMGKYSVCDETKTVDYIYVYKSEPYEVSATTIFENLMLNEGETAKPYEPYSGGFPSPSPDWKQDIQNSGKEVNGQYEVGVRVGGKNIIDIPDLSSDITERTILCNISNDVYISCYGELAEVSENIWRIRVKYKYGSYNYVFDKAVEYYGNMEDGVSFSATKENPIIEIIARGINITSGKYTKIQVEYGKEKTSYEPYKNQSITLHSPRPLTKWDRLVKKDGVWNWEFNSNTEVFDGSEDEAWAKYVKSDENQYGNIFFLSNFSNKNDKNRTAKCDRFKSFSGGWLNIQYGYCQNVDYTFGICVGKDAFNNVETLKTWLQSNPITVQYQTMTHEYIPLSEEDAQVLDSLTSYYPTTVISTDTDPQMTIDVEYGCDTKNYIDQRYVPVEKYNSLESRISAIESNIVNNI